MGVLLNRDSKNVPGEELEGNVSLFRHVEKRHRVDNLILGHHQIDNPEVLFQSVADEYDALTDQITQFQVAGFQRRQMLAGNVGIQISRFDTGEFGEIVDHLSGTTREHVYYTIDERNQAGYTARVGGGGNLHYYNFASRGTQSATKSREK